MEPSKTQAKDSLSCGAVAARFLPVWIHVVATRVKSADGDSAFTVKTTTEHVTITQVQAPRKQTPTIAKKNQAGAIHLQINIGRRSAAPLKMQKQSIQAAFRE